jgi:uncharacterized membrane protein
VLIVFLSLFFSTQTSVPNVNAAVGFTNNIKNCVLFVIFIALFLLIKKNPYRVPYALRDEMKNQVDEMLSKGVITPCASQWAATVILATVILATVILAPVILVPKKSAD